MFKFQFKCAATLLVSSFCTLTFAIEPPKAEDLVSKMYGGIHGLYIQTDNDRLTTTDPASYMDYGTGIGGEIGYRWLPSTEFRLSYSRFDLNAAKSGFQEPNGATTSVDVLFFPSEQNFYLLAGINNLDIVNSQTSSNLGAGYRHYFSERAALYFESKYNYQFSERYDDLSSQLGFVYFFGESAKPAKPKVIAPLDTDKDGVIDTKDKCPRTPMIDKVDINGCTLFEGQSISKQLLVNFDHNKTEIKPEFDDEIATMARFLKANPSLTLTIEGHTSSLGSKQYNQTLSQERANEVVKVLISTHGISSNRLSAVGFGEERLINPENSAMAHAQNRRIMATVELVKKVPVKR
ncbi:outer membrane porin OprF [Colwellia sp. KU-HH00111]|uniref:OmpA family protein n=1 Tax=Colwellia sp. KU-HH00111 TaxID=3127652 RepID=UPI0031042C55